MGVPPMPHDQTYLQAEKKIEQALKSCVRELVLQYPSIQFAKQSLESKGGEHDA
jgi:hypothetical protein